MPDNIPSLPGGAVPPKPSDSKVLPKKETVRINLPPKPSAAPTIKLPTLPPGGPSLAGGPSAQRPALAPATAAPKATAAPSAAPTSQKPAAPRPSRPAPAPVAAIKMVDKILAIAAAVAALAAIGTTVYLAYFIDYTPK